MSTTTPTVEDLTSAVLSDHAAAVRAASAGDDDSRWLAEDRLNASLSRLHARVDTGAVLVLAGDLNASTHAVRVSTTPADWRELEDQQAAVVADMLAEELADASR